MLLLIKIHELEVNIMYKETILKVLIVVIITSIFYYNFEKEAEKPKPSRNNSNYNQDANYKPQNHYDEAPNELSDKDSELVIIQYCKEIVREKCHLSSSVSFPYSSGWIIKEKETDNIFVDTYSVSSYYEVSDTKVFFTIDIILNDGIISYKNLQTY